ncbi:Protein of unknown function [Gryllus bimaculatus]|nr:Protein of unknown function [Gryllus bimaculatus]
MIIAVTKAKARVLGPADLYVKAGSLVQLTCVISQAQTRQPFLVPAAGEMGGRGPPRPRRTRAAAAAAARPGPPRAAARRHPHEWRASCRPLRSKALRRPRRLGQLHVRAHAGGARLRLRARHQRVLIFCLHARHKRYVRLSMWVLLIFYVRSNIRSNS